MPEKKRHVLHMMYRFSAGGMENVIVQLVNGLPRDRFRHTIMPLTRADPVFSARIERDDVEIVELNKPPGQPLRSFPPALRHLRRLRPDVMHTCNLAALEFMPVGALAGVGWRVHVEHGWDVSDPDGSNARFRAIRRLLRPFVHRQVAVSRQLHDYLANAVGVAPGRLRLIANGVDTNVFRPARQGDCPPDDFPFDPGEHRVIGYVGRLVPIKNPGLLVDAFIALVKRDGAARSRYRLAIVGDGELAPGLRQRLRDAGIADLVWMPGTRSDVSSILRHFHCFVLPSLAEGTSCTLQEALACEVIVVATAVGGNSDVLGGGRFGSLIPSGDVSELAAAIENACADDEAKTRATAGRVEVIRNASLSHMLDAYETLFTEGD